MAGNAIAAGQVVAGYVLEEKLGQGGFGEIWSAHHKDAEKLRVAVKLGRSAEVGRSLRREGVLQFRLRHPGIVMVHHFDLEAEPPFVVMDLAPGGSLRQRLDREKPLPLADAVRIFGEVLEAVAHAHGHGVVHRDLKPENVLFSGEGRALVADFGLGLATEQETRSLLLSQGSESLPRVAGTIAYMSREQRDGASVDARADVYALGVILFELLTGERPELGDRPSSVRPGVPAALDAVYERAVARLDTRFGSVADLEKELSRALGTTMTPSSRAAPAPAARAFCDACGEALHGPGAFCDGCGAVLGDPNGRFCDACGAALDASDRHCDRCGAPALA